MGEDKITVSDRKQVHVEFNQDFDEVDLLSDAEKAALKEDIDGEDEPGAGEDDDKGEAAAEEAKKADEAAKKADDREAKKAADDEAKKADEEAGKAEQDTKKDEKKAEKPDQDDTDQPDEKEKETPETKDTRGTQQAFPDIGPPLTMRGLSEDELNKVNQGLTDAKKKFQEGEIDYEQYLDIRDDLKQKLWQHELAVNMTAESIDNRWEWEQETFLNAPENEWINGDDVVYAAFASTVNMILATEEGQVIPGPQLLAKAREEVAARFSPTRREDKAKEEEEAKKKEALKNAKEKEANKQPPETLGGKPAAEVDDGVGEFDWLDKLDGEDYEKAVAGLNEDQLKRYEASI